MNTTDRPSTLSDILRRTIMESAISYLELQKSTGVSRASVMRFVRGERTLRLDMADRLAAYFDLELRKRK